MKFIAKVLRDAWRVSPWRNLLVLITIVLASVSTVFAPYVLGQGVASLVEASDRATFLTTAGTVAVTYAVFWLIGSSLTYVIYPLYGLIEQRLQSDVMARSLADSLLADPTVRHRMDNGEISFAIDTEAGAYRDSLASLYLSIFPAMLSLIAGVWAVIVASSWVEGLILIAAVVIYALVSKPLIKVHQKAQAAFFKESMRSFGVLGNSLALWKEALVFGVPNFLRSRYRADRVVVEEAGKASYAATRRLYLAQGFVLAVTIFALVFTISYRAPAGQAEVIGAIISTVGIAVAAMGPLQSVGFGISSLAVSIAQERESGEKIRPLHQKQKADPAAWQGQVDKLAALADGHHGRPIWVLGASGAGKTTVLEGILGLNTSSAKTTTAKTISSFGYVQQSPGIINATAVDNVIFGRNVTPETAGNLLTALGLESFTANGADHLRDVAGEEGGVSGGERQRIALARALTADDSLIVLDEPTSGLDAATRTKVWQLIERYAQNNTVIVATHDETAPILDGDVVFSPSKTPSKESSKAPSPHGSNSH